MKLSMNSYFSKLASFGIGLARFAYFSETTFFIELVCDITFSFSSCWLMEISSFSFLAEVVDGVFLVLLCCLSRKPFFSFKAFLLNLFFLQACST